MLTRAGTDLRTHLDGAFAFAVYCVGYRVLSVQLSCGSLAVSGVPFVAKYT